MESPQLDGRRNAVRAQDVVVPRARTERGIDAGQPLRIAQVAPLYEAVPPGAYGGTERVITTLCDGLVALGHDVTLFGRATSTTAARLEPFETPLRERFNADEMGNVAPDLHREMLAEVAWRSDEFDVIHSHLDVLTLPFTPLIATPTVLTLHGRLDLDSVRELMPRYGSVPLVSISNAQRLALADLDLTWAATVYNGLDLSPYRAVPHGRHGYLAFVGRIAAEQGPLSAIEVARRTDVPLRMAATVDPTDVPYSEKEVVPYMGSDVDFVGAITEDEKPAFYAGARATLFASDWPEPSGLVMIESLAAGTPVVALRRSSLPEVIEDGITGFICEDVDEMADAVRLIDQIDPEACRRGAKRFAADRMCRGYLDVYRALPATCPPRTQHGLRQQQLLPSSGENGCR